SWARARMWRRADPYNFLAPWPRPTHRGETHERVPRGYTMATRFGALVVGQLTDLRRAPHCIHEFVEPAHGPVFRRPIHPTPPFRWCHGETLGRSQRRGARRRPGDVHARAR